MKILVTGGAGFIGCNLVRRLVLQSDHEVVNLDKFTYAANEAALAALEGHSGYVLERVDLADAAATGEVFARHRPDTVIHLAAESHVDRSIRGPEEFIRSNIVGTFNLLQAALGYWEDQGRPKSFRLLHGSTDEVYGSLAPGEPAFDESTRYDPRSPYSASKAASDHLARAWFNTYGLPVMVTHCSNNYGPYQHPEKLIPTVIGKCLAGESIPIYGTGENVREWIHVEDHIDALLLVLEKGEIGRTYDIGAAMERTNLELVQTLCRIVGELVPQGGYERLISFVADRPGHDFRYAIDSGRMRRELGWAAKTDFENGLRATVQWYLDHREIWQTQMG
jgi:dTDP-glucose 4,6-dehydratase